SAPRLRSHPQGRNQRFTETASQPCGLPKPSPRRVSTARSTMRFSVIHHSGRYLRTHHRLLWRVTRNELTSRYAGSVFGLGWAVLTPLMMLGIYAVVYLL